MSNIKFDTDRLNQIIQNTDKNSSVNATADNDDVRNFEKELLHNNEEENNNDSSPQGYSFESFFSNMFEEKQITKTMQVGPSDNPDLGLTEKLVDRILVSDPKDGNQKIRIKLGDDILPDTEICLQRDIDGSLRISLNTSNAVSLQTLVSQQYELKNRLEQLENRQVTVEVNTENTEQGNDSNKKSRGLFDIYEQYRQS